MTKIRTTTKNKKSIQLKENHKDKIVARNSYNYGNIRTIDKMTNLGNFQEFI